MLAGLALSFGGVSYDRSPIGHGVSGDVCGDLAVRSIPRLLSPKTTAHDANSTESLPI
jgi:hypothetical protein